MQVINSHSVILCALTHVIYSFIYDRDEVAFSDIETDSEALVHRFCSPHKQCYSCALRAKSDWESDFQRTDSDISLYGVSYHLHDFVYVRVGQSVLYKVAQIVSLRDHEGLDIIDIRFFSRCDRRFQDMDQDPNLEVIFFPI